MRLTHLGHACLLVEAAGTRLLVDPGTYSADFTTLSDLDAILLTHQHADHVDADRLPALVAANPRAVVLAEPETVALDEAPPPDVEIAVEAAEIIEPEGEAPEAVEEPEATAEPRDSLPEQESIGEAADESALVAGEVSASTGDISVTEEPPAAFNNLGES